MSRVSTLLAADSFGEHIGVEVLRNLPLLRNRETRHVVGVKSIPNHDAVNIIVFVNRLDDLAELVHNTLVVADPRHVSPRQWRLEGLDDQAARPRTDLVDEMIKVPAVAGDD